MRVPTVLQRHAIAYAEEKIRNLWHNLLKFSSNPEDEVNRVISLADEWKYVFAFLSDIVVELDCRLAITIDSFQDKDTAGSVHINLLVNSRKECIGYGGNLLCPDDEEVKVFDWLEDDFRKHLRTLNASLMAIPSHDAEKMSDLLDKVLYSLHAMHVISNFIVGRFGDDDLYQIGMIIYQKPTENNTHDIGVYFCDAADDVSAVIEL